MTRAEDKGNSNHGRICKRFKIARALTPTRFEVVEAIVMMSARSPMDQIGCLRCFHGNWSNRES
jgi:hypothetical protein